MAGLKKGQQVIDELDAYDPHDIFRPPNKIEKSQWHLDIDPNKNAIKIAEKFHKKFKKLEQSSSITREIDTIKTTFLKFLPTDYKDWNTIRKYFKQARDENNPIPVIKAYTLNQDLTRRLNKHSAINTHHALKLYCTLLNCPALAQTQEYTEALTKIFFYPKLKEHLVRTMVVYRGAVLDDEKFIANYNEGATIITTTFLSTSRNRNVAEIFGDVPPGHMNKISLFCTYNINNIDRYTALNLQQLSEFGHEEEILILRYVPFKIRSVERKNDGQRIEMCLDECPE